jgi:hypothetical protein
MTAATIVSDNSNEQDKAKHMIAQAVPIVKAY